MSTSRLSHSERESKMNNNNMPGVEVTCKGYTDFKNREDIDLKFIAFEQIGNGTFGKIHRIQYDGQDMALKIVHQDPDYCNRELDILERLRNHPHIIHICFSYYTRYEGKIYLNLITELLSHTLYNKIYNGPAKKVTCSRRSSSRNNAPVMCMNVQELQRCFKGIFLGLKFMHSKNISHRDLKPENLGFTFSGDLKIIDMGSAKIIAPKVKNSYEVCTLLYRAPELLLCNQDYKCDIDIWAIGCILAETISCIPIFFEQNTTSILRQIVSVIGRPPRRLLSNITRSSNLEYLQNAPTGNVETYIRSNVINKQQLHDAQAVDDIVILLKGILVFENRLTAKEALDTPFFAKNYLEEGQGPSQNQTDGNNHNQILQGEHQQHNTSSGNMNMNINNNNHNNTTHNANNANNNNTQIATNDRPQRTSSKMQLDIKSGKESQGQISFQSQQSRGNMEDGTVSGSTSKSSSESKKHKMDDYADDGNEDIKRPRN